MTSRLNGQALTLVALISLASCSSPQGTTEAPTSLPPLEACSLFLVEDADPGDIFGLLPVRAPVELTIGQDTAKCSYGTPEPPIMVVSLEIRRLKSTTEAHRQQRGSESMLPQLAGAVVEVEEGVGDRAAWAGGRLDQLHVVAGEMRLIVTVEVGEESGRRDHAKRIALAALERLQQPTPAAKPE